MSDNNNDTDKVPMVASYRQDDSPAPTTGYNLMAKRVSLHDKHPMVVNQKK